MAKLKKIGEIREFTLEGVKEVIETLEKQGFIVVQDNCYRTDWVTYHILKEV